MGYGGDLGGIIVTLLDIWAIIAVLQSGESDGGKILWVLLVVLLPLVGFILWYVIGPGSKTFPLRR